MKAINNLMHNEMGVKDELESTEESEESASKFLPVEYNNPMKTSETPCIMVTTLYEDPTTDPTIEQIYRRVGFQLKEVPQVPAPVPQAPAQNPVPLNLVPPVTQPVSTVVNHTLAAQPQVVYQLQNVASKREKKDAKMSKHALMLFGL